MVSVTVMAITAAIVIIIEITVASSSRKGFPRLAASRPGLIPGGL
jgi:hypothetical protein